MQFGETNFYLQDFRRAQARWHRSTPLRASLGPTAEESHPGGDMSDTRHSRIDMPAREEQELPAGLVPSCHRLLPSAEKNPRRPRRLKKRAAVSSATSVARTSLKAKATRSEVQAMSAATRTMKTIASFDGDFEMGICETCGNDYDKAFRVSLNGKEHVFDSFECAIHALAPTCPHCGTRVVGHGVEIDDTVYCCAHCAKEEEGTTTISDRE